MNNGNCTMIVTFLGWWGAFPQPGEATCGVMVRTPEGATLLDLGSGTLAQFLCAGQARELRGLLLSHLHYDHMGDVGCLSYLINNNLRRGLRDKNLPVYAPATPEVIFRTLDTPYYDLTVVTPDTAFSIAGMSVTVMPVSHTVECYSYRLEKDGKVLVYMTDTVPLDGASDFARDCDLLICEATNSLNTLHSPGTGHMSDLEAGELARKAGAKQLCLFHLPSDGDIPLMRQRAASTFGKEVFTPDIKRSFLL